MTRNTVIFFIAALCMFVATHARADTRVTVHDFQGPSAARVRDDVVNLLERQSGVTIVSKGQIESAARKLGVDRTSSDGRQALARELKLSAWMTGVVQRRNGKLRLTVEVYDGAQHVRVGRAQVIGSNAGRLSAAIRDRLWRQSRRAIMEASAPEPSTVGGAGKNGGASFQPDMVLTQSDVDSTRDGLDTEQEARTSHDSTLRTFVGIGSPYRSLAYNQPITSSLGDYRLSGAPMADIQFAFFPARAATAAWPSWFGIDARAQITLNAATLDRDGNQFKSRYDAFHLGLRARVPLGAHSVSAFSGYAMSRFAISPQDGRVSSPTPSVDYRSIRSGLGGELALGDAWLLGLDAAWLSFLSVGDIGQWFPRASAGGLEVAMFGTFRMTRGTFARVAATYQRTFFDFHSRPGDEFIAGGATDESLALSLGMGVSL